MRQASLNRVWYGGRPPGALLGALEYVYRAASERRRERDRRRAAKDLADRPIIVVGNITAGGAGKTPLVVRLCELLSGAGLEPAVISRGYGRATRDPVCVRSDTPAAAAGDEPLLIARRSGVPVHVDRDREAAARAAFAAGAKVLVADDGLQRLRLPRALEICVVDGVRGFGNGRLLPAGPLREPVDRLEQVDWVVVNQAADGLLEEAGEGPPARLSLPSDRTVSMTLKPEAFVPVAGGDPVSPTRMADRLRERAVCAVAGIGHPQRYFDTLSALGIAPGLTRAFDDHHAFSRSDFDGFEGAVLMTEKDAVKCERLGLEDAWYLRVGARLPADWERTVIERARELVEHAPAERGQE